MPESKSVSKFEWRPEDVTILTPEEALAAEERYQEWLVATAGEPKAEDTIVSSSSGSESEES